MGFKKINIEIFLFLNNKLPAGDGLNECHSFN